MCVQIANFFPNGEVAHMPGHTAHFMEKLSKNINIWGPWGSQKDGHRSPESLPGGEVRSRHSRRGQLCPPLPDIRISDIHTRYVFTCV